MLVVDTNVLLRLVLQDDKAQEAQARAHLAKLQRAGERLFLSQAVVLECLWVLEFELEVPRESIRRLMEGLFSMEVFQVEQEQRLRRALQLYDSHGVAFVDALVAATGQEAGFSGALSFDREMAKLGVHWVRP